MGDPERFCACGHHETEHGRRGHGLRGAWVCRSEAPDLCACLGFRLARSSKTESVTQTIERVLAL